MQDHHGSRSPARGRRIPRASARRVVRFAASGLLFALICAASARAQDGSRTDAPPAPAAEAERAARIDAEKAAERARLKAEFDRCSAELRTAVSRYQADVATLRAQGVAQDKWPPHPNAAHYPRFEELGAQDQPDALRWCLTALGQMGLTAVEVAARKGEIYARLVSAHADEEWMFNVARWIQADGAASGLGFERADALLRTLAATSTVRAIRSGALSARSGLLGTRNDPASRAENERIVRELAANYGDTQAGAAAKGRLFQLDHLAPGKTPPDVEAVDTEGKPLRLADYRGKVTVLDFWGFWCGVCVQSLPHLKALAQRHAGDPFALVGIATDANLPEFQRQARAAGVTWRNAWTGGRQSAWPTSWGVQRYPTVYVLDAQGVVRFVDVRGAELDRAVQSLLDEMRAPKTAGSR